jgi:hypothetical protein
MRTQDHVVRTKPRLRDQAGPGRTRMSISGGSYTVVSGKVSKVSEQVIIKGSLLDFYPGEWADNGGYVRSMLWIGCSNQKQTMP